MRSSTRNFRSNSKNRITHLPDELLHDSHKKSDHRLSCEVVYPFFSRHHRTYRIHFSSEEGCSFIRIWRGWRGRMAGDIKLPTFDRISDCTEGELVEFHGGIEWDPTRASRGPQTKRKGLYILRHYPFRGRSIRLRGKISIRNDIERLIRKGWNPLCLELDSVPPLPACDDNFFFSSFLLFWIWINTSCLEKILRSRAFIWELFQRCLFGCCEFVRVLKKNKLDISLIFKLEAWKCSFFFKLR